MSADVLAAIALAEDLGDPPSPDPTGAATVDPAAVLEAHVVAREPGVLAGMAFAAAVPPKVDARLRLQPLAGDGDAISAGQAVAVLAGPARAVLVAERTLLNLLCHASGVATLTARFVAAVAGTGCQVRDTRKTLPGLRALQKAAVVAGGGSNHRMRLVDGLLVKDNHVAAAGGVGPATRSALRHAGGLPVQVEVDSLVQLEEALAVGAPSVLLDNFTLEDLRAAVARCRAQGRAVFAEASGGVTLGTAAAIAATGVDAIAVGALTHSAPALDIGLDVL